MALAAVFLLSLCACAYGFGIGYYEFNGTLIKEGLSRGDVCKEEGGREWRCWRMRDCPVSMDKVLRDRKLPRVCTEWPQEVTVCCEPEDTARNMPAAEEKETEEE